MITLLSIPEGAQVVTTDIAGEGEEIRINKLNTDDVELDVGSQIVEMNYGDSNPDAGEEVAHVVKLNPDVVVEEAQVLSTGKESPQGSIKVALQTNEDLNEVIFPDDMPQQ